MNIFVVLCFPFNSFEFAYNCWGGLYFKVNWKAVTVCFSLLRYGYDHGMLQYIGILHYSITVGIYA